ncbi:MAG: hypothetical protein IJ733_01765 [Lachnospiraceae bacterium]|nr:hypothetical protein [Lachnospiraceae bacterium]
MKAKKYGKMIMIMLLIFSILIAGLPMKKVYAKGWASGAKKIKIGMLYKESFSGKDTMIRYQAPAGYYYDCWYDAFKFNVSKKRKLTLVIKSSDERYFSSRVRYYIYKKGNTKKAAGEFEIAYNYDFDSGIGKYIGKDALTLKKGTYYFVVEYEPNPMDDALGTKYSFKIRK